MTVLADPRPTGSPAGSTPAGSATAPGTPVAAWLRRAGWPLAIAGLIAATVLVTVLTSGKGNNLPLDPEGVGPDGARALAQVLDHHGVPVQVERTRAATLQGAHGDPAATVFVSQTGLLDDDDVAALGRLARTGQRLVVAAPTQRQLDALAPGVREVGRPGQTTADAGCALRAAVAAGRADAGGYVYQVDSGSATLCYPVAGHPSYVEWRSGTRVTVVIGQARLLTNDRLARQGNAALALGTLGAGDRVIWFVPSAQNAAGQGSSLGSLLPSWVGWVVLQLLLVTLVCMVWRGRRMGRLVPEPLPVVVRAVETTEGRARMYRRARSQARAAAILREATLARLRERTGLPRAAPAADVVAVVAARTGIPDSQVATLLSGPLPHDDAGLVRLARILDQLDREVRRP